jgi:hypothetical protein
MGGSSYTHSRRKSEINSGEAAYTKGTSADEKPILVDAMMMRTFGREEGQKVDNSSNLRLKSYESEGLLLEILGKINIVN